jgi:16S rRNA (guanine527-N7)-methyltransferase
VKHFDVDHQSVGRVLNWVGSSLTSGQWEQLQTFAEWLKGEAVGAGGLGPNEAVRVWTRHLADSLAFAFAWRDMTPPARLLDMGSGVGLPGIPLAVLWPGTVVTLLDRSRRRVDLARRATRLVKLANIDIQEGEVDRQQPGWEGVVSRAVFAPDQAMTAANNVLARSGVAVVGLRGKVATSRFSSTPVGGRSVRTVEVPPTVLDGPVSLLIMGSREH